VNISRWGRQPPQPVDAESKGQSLEAVPEPDKQGTSDAWSFLSEAYSLNPSSEAEAEAGAVVAPEPVADAASSAPPENAAEAPEAPPSDVGQEPAAVPRSEGTLDQGEWRLEQSGWSVEPRTAMSVLDTLSSKVSRGAVGDYQPIPLGLTPLDKSLGGGLRTGDLVLIGGAQGTGKTTLALQMARNIALGGQASVLYVCFEHDEEYLLNRLIAMESALEHMPQPTTGVKVQDVRKEVLATWVAHGSQQTAELTANPRLRPALERIARYGQSLYLLRGSQTTSTVENMHKLVQAYRDVAPHKQLVVFVDYLQKVPMIPDATSEVERVTNVVQGLKDLALTHSVPLVSIVAADREGLKASRLRNHHLRGSSAINYEADVIIILNEKYNIVAKVNIEFNPYQAQRFRDWIILTIEKNRSGKNTIDLEYEKHFEFACFDPEGRQVQEKLIEERLYND
jgi:replicative DNA helicase